MAMHAVFHLSFVPPSYIISHKHNTSAHYISQG